MITDKKTAIFFILIVIFILGITVSNFIHFYIIKDYQLYTFTSCDPDLHTCFEVDLEVTDFAFYTEPYAKVEVNAHFAPTCLDEQACTNFTCDNIETCTITYCSEETLEGAELCTNSKINL